MDPKLTVKATGTTGEVLIYDAIGSSFWGDRTDAKTFAAEISELDVTELTVRVNSPGGDAFDGVAIMNALKRHPAKVTAYVDGLAASAASVIVAGGADEVVMCEGAQIMIHDAMVWAAGNAEELGKAAAMVDKLSNDMAGIYARKAGTPRDEWRESMREETWFSADEAVAVGLADRVDEDETAELDVTALARNPVFAQFKYAGREHAPRPAMLAPTSRKDPQMDFLTKVAQKLGLPTSDLDEATTLAALDEVLQEQEPDTTTTTDDTKDDDTSGKSDEDDAAVTAKEDEDDNSVIVDKDVWEDVLRRAARGDEAESETAEREAEELVTAAIKDGRILAAKKEKWVTLALDDFAATKAALDKFAPGTIPVSEKGRGGSDESRETGARKAADHKAKNQAFLAASGLK